MPNIQILPGNPAWSLALAAFAWLNRSLREICEQIKDTRRNGGRTLEKIHDHVAYDPLVGWAWHPGRPEAGADDASDVREADSAVDRFRC